jgi:hypothetical protein
MYTCPQNLTHSFFTICKIVKFKNDKKHFFPNTNEGQQSLGGQKNNFFE